MIATVIYNNPMTEWWFESGAVYWFWGGLFCLLLAFVAYIAIAWLIGCWQDWRNSRRK